MRMVKTIAPTHPGETLIEEFLRPRGITQFHLAKDIGLSVLAVSAIVHGKCPIDVVTARKLSSYFDLAPDFWVNLQASYDREVAGARRKAARQKG
jgi:addiction module HigA family antidote